MEILISNLLLVFLAGYLCTSEKRHKLSKQIIKQQSEAIDNSLALNDELCHYCLNHIINQAIKNEDYETANRCNQLIKNFKI